jgi:hypothetical protein
VFLLAFNICTWAQSLSLRSFPPNVADLNLRRAVLSPIWLPDAPSTLRVGAADETLPLSGALSTPPVFSPPLTNFHSYTELPDFRATSNDGQGALSPLSRSAGALAVSTSKAQRPETVQWRPLMGASLRYLAIMHMFRLSTEQATKNAFLHEPIWGGYLKALGAMHGWSDGDGYYENYLGHPIQGGVSGYIWIHNDPRYRNVEFGKDPDYWKSRLRAYAFSWAFSAQFEVGLLSEASIGNIQRYCCQYGFVDHVITPNGGMAWMVGEDILDKYVVRRVEDRTQNLGLRIAARVALNPAESFANLMNMEYPWHRENRDAPSRYVSGAGTYVRREELRKIPSPDDPLVPSFEFTATLPSIMKEGGLSCIGGGAITGFRIASELQWTAEVSGCTFGSNMPPNWSGDSLTFTTGPEWIRHSESRWTPHSHFRFGGQKVTLLHSDPQKRSQIENSLPPNTKLNQYYTLFTQTYESTAMSLSVGAGVDYRLHPGFALRLVNLDYVHSWLSPVVGRDFNGGVRLTSGVVLRIGTW